MQNEGRERRGKATLNRAPFNQRAHNGGHKDNKAERGSCWLTRQLKSQIYGQLGSVLSTMFKPQRQAPGDRDYTGKAISRQVMNLSRIQTPSLSYVQVAMRLRPSSAPRRRRSTFRFFNAACRGSWCVLSKILSVPTFSRPVESNCALKKRFFNFQQPQENRFKLVASRCEKGSFTISSHLSILWQMSPIPMMNLSPDIC